MNYFTEGHQYRRTGGLVGTGLMPYKAHYPKYQHFMLTVDNKMWFTGTFCLRDVLRRARKKWLKLVSNVGKISMLRKKILPFVISIIFHCKWKRAMQSISGRSQAERGSRTGKLCLPGKGPARRIESCAIKEEPSLVIPQQP